MQSVDGGGKTARVPCQATHDLIINLFTSYRL